MQLQPLTMSKISLKPTYLWVIDDFENPIREILLLHSKTVGRIGHPYIFNRISVENGDFLKIIGFWAKRRRKWLNQESQRLYNIFNES